MNGLPHGCFVQIYRVRQLQEDLDQLEHRFPGIADDFTIAEKILKQNPARGPVISASSSAQNAKHASIRKMQVRSKAAQRGKTKGFRLVYHVRREEMIFHVYLLHIYFKGDKQDLGSSDYTRLEAILVSLKPKQAHR